MHRLAFPLVLVALSGSLISCIQTVGEGPDLGQCADYPAGRYTYGEVGIGTCLAGPTDLRFFERDGTTWLAVSNSNPLVHFNSGSVTLIDWDSVTFDQPTNPLHTLNVSAVAIENYLGGIEIIDDTLFVSSRFSEASLVATTPDKVWTIDIGSPNQAQLTQSITVGADPFSLTKTLNDQLYVANLTDGTLSVIDGLTQTVLDLAPGAEITNERFDDGLDTDSTAELGHIKIDVAESVPAEEWSLHWVEGTARVWVPVNGGLERWTGGGVNYDPTGRGAEFIEQVEDPWFEQDGDTSVVYVGRGGQIMTAQLGKSAADWSALTLTLAEGSTWDRYRSAPAFADSPLDRVLYYDGRDAQGGLAQIGAAPWNGNTYAPQATPLFDLPEGFESAEDPFVLYDDRSDTLRMWLSLWDGAAWTLGYSESVDGLSWSTPVVLNAFADQNVASPAIHRVNGRWVLWATQWTGRVWHQVQSESFDGLDWSSPVPLFEVDQATDLRAPPRPGVLFNSESKWTLEGRARGTVYPFTSGQTMAIAGFSFDAAQGFEVGTSAIGGPASGGLVPGSVVEVNGQQRLYVTLYGDDGRPTLGLLEQNDERWNLVEIGLIAENTGGNSGGVESPVVWNTAAGWQMAYGATDDFGQVRIWTATSSDGVNWVPADTPVLEPSVRFDGQSQVPHSVQVTADEVFIWYTGSNGSRSRIGVAQLGLDGWTRVEGTNGPWQLDLGEAGSFDDTVIGDPAYWSDADGEHLFYSADDGAVQRIGHVWRASPEAAWTRSTSSLSGQTWPTLSGEVDGFSESGVHSPVMGSGPDFQLFYAGVYNGVSRVGLAAGSPSSVYATPRFTRINDRILFSSVRGEEGNGAIILGQTLREVVTDGKGISSVRYDATRGFLFVTSSANQNIIVIDVRDDSDANFNDANFNDIEAVLSLSPNSSKTVFRDALPIPGTDLLYTAADSPDQVLVFDLSLLVDDAEKDLLSLQQIHSIAVQAPITPTNIVSGISGAATGTGVINSIYRSEDEGIKTQSTFSVAGLTLNGDGTLLLLPHFRDNSVQIIDLQEGPFGALTHRIANVGENPHRIVLSPDKRFAVVANYMGEIDANGLPSSSLAVIDLDPASPTYLSLLTRIVNR